MNTKDLLLVCGACVVLLGLVYWVDWTPSATTATDLGVRWDQCQGYAPGSTRNPTIRWEPVVNRVEWVDHSTWEVVVDPSRENDPLVMESSVPHGFAHLLTQVYYGDTPEHGVEFQTVLLRIQTCLK